MYSPEGIRTEILLRNNQWLDISSNVRGEGAGEGIRITAGRKNERSRTNFSAVFTLKDPDGYFNDQNPRSPYFGLIGRNTQCRVQCGNQAAQIDTFDRTITDAWNKLWYSFDATSEGWVGEGSTSVARVTSPVHDGAGSLRATNTLGGGFGSCRLNDAGAITDGSTGAGPTFYAWVLVEAGAPGTGWQGRIELQDPGFTWQPGPNYTLTPGVWKLIDFTPDAGLLSTYRAIGFEIGATDVNATVNVYVDTIRQGTLGEHIWDITTSAGSTPADFDVNGTEGVHTHPTENILHYSTLDTGEKNHRVRARFQLSAGTVTGANASIWILGRFTDISNYYACIVNVSTAGNVSMQFQKRVAGSLSAVSSSITTHSGYSGLFNSVEFIVEFYLEGAKLYAKMWDATNFTEPNSWQLIDEDFSLSTGNSAGVASRREGGNTNANLQFQFPGTMFVPGTIRAHVELANFGALAWNSGGIDIRQAVQGAGLKRRLGAGNAPVLKSPVLREVTSLGSSNIVGYWPMEDGIHTTQIGSGLSGGLPLNVNGTNIQFGVASELPGIASMVAIGDNTSLSVGGIQSIDTGQIRACIFIQFPDAGTLPDNAAIMEIHQTKDPNIRKWRLVYGTGGSLKLWGYNQSFTLVADSGPIGFGVDGTASLIQFDVVQNGANVDYNIHQDEILQDGSNVGTSLGGTFASVTVGAINAASVAPIPGLSGCSVSHLILANSTSILSNLEQPMIGYWGETTSDRFERLCGEEGITYQIIGTEGTSTSARMGAQRIATLLQNLEDIEDTERGIIYEARHFFGLVFRQHHTLLNQSSLTGTPSLDYEDSHLSGEPFPDPDDLEIGNDVVATRAFGGEYRSTEDSGPMSVEEYPDGIGRYELPVATRVQQDSQLPNIARWDRHIGTWIGPRYPTIEIQMHRTAITNDTGLTNSLTQMQIGDYMAISNPPLWLPPEKIELLSQGYTEIIRNTHWTFTHNCVPAEPYRVAVRDSNVGGEPCIRDSLDSEVDSTYTIGQTTLNVQVNVNPAWTTGAVDFDIMVAGVRLHVTNIGAVSGGVQAFTVDATPVNGVTTPSGGTTIPAGEPVHVYPLSRRALQKDSGNSSFATDLPMVTGVDTPPARWVDGENTGVFTNTSFVESDQGLIFTAPSTGRVIVSYSGRIINDTAGAETLMGIVTRQGSVLGDGATHEAISDGKCLRGTATDHKQISITRMIAGLTAGKDYNIVFAHRRSAGNAQVNERFLLVRADRTQGGRPGTSIETVPESTFAEQGASDTTTSTSFTTADMTVCGENFFAPASGKVLIHFSANMDNSAANNVIMSYHIRNGGTVNSGTDVVTPSDARAISLLNTNNLECGATVMASGLTPGNEYNIVLEHRVTGGTGTLVDRRVAVEQVF